MQNNAYNLYALIYIIMSLLFIHSFTTIITGHLENVGSVSCISSKFYVSFYKNKRSHLLTTLSTSSETSLVLGNCTAPGNRKQYTQIPIFSQKLIFYHWLQLVSVAFLDITDTFFFFQNNICNCSCLVTTMYPSGFIQEKMVVYENSGLPRWLSVKNPPAIQVTQVRYHGCEDPLEKEMATHSIILAWEIPQTEQPGRLQSTESQKSGT